MQLPPWHTRPAPHAMQEAPPVPQWLGSSVVSATQAPLKQHPEQFEALQPPPATQVPFEQVGVVPLQVLQEPPPTPQYRLVTPGWQLPVLSTQPQEAPWHCPSPLQDCPETTSQAWHAAPLIPQAEFAAPLWHVPVLSQQPGQLEGSHPPPSPAFRQTPRTQSWPGRQVAQAKPWVPQAVVWSPPWQSPAAVQHPLQLDGRQLALLGPQEGAAPRTSPRTNPPARMRKDFMSDATTPRPRPKTL